MKRSHIGAACAAAALSQLLTGAPAWAQGGLEEILVTATRRETNLQDVPISIIAITGDDLQMRGMDSVESLSATVPNLNIIGGLAGPGTTSFTVRGIPRVGTYIDGIWQVGNAGLLTRQLVELERVEVLRGPQGTLYGRDSTGGAIRLVTKRPAEEFGGQINATVGSLDRRDVTASVDLPLTDKLRSKWTAASLQRDGYVQSLTVDRKYGAIDDQVLRGDLLWLPTEKLSFRFNYQSNDSTTTEARVQSAVFPELAQTFGIGSAPGAVRLAAGIIQLYTIAGQPITALTQQAGFAGGQVGKWQTKSEITIPDEISDEQLSMEVNLALGDSLNLQFLTASTNQTSNTYVDWDNTQYTVFNDIFANKIDLFSQEIQLSGKTDRLDWVAGAYYWDQENVGRNPSYSIQEFTSGQLNIANVFASPQCTNVPVGFLACQATYGIILSQQADDMNFAGQHGWAVFGEATIHLTDALDLTVGYRHHDQTNESQAMVVVPGVTAAKPPRSNTAFGPGDIFAGQRVGVVDSASFEKGTSRLALNYNFTDSIMGYVGYSEGFNSGGFGVEQLSCKRRVSPFLPEDLQNFEVGIRSDLAGGLLRLNATLFSTKWNDIQLAGESIDDCFTPPQVGTNLRTQNVASAKAEGVEIELTIAPTESLLFNVNLGLLDTNYVGISTPVPGLTLNTEFSQAPKKTGNLGVQHTARLEGGGTLTTRFDYSFSDQFWRSQIPNFRTEYYGLPPGFDEGGDYGLVNLRLAYVPSGAAWELAVFGTNLTNEYYLNSGFFHSLWDIDFASVGRPREAGVSLKINFKQAEETGNRRVTRENVAIKSRRRGCNRARPAFGSTLRRFVVAASLAAALQACSGADPDLGNLRAEEIDYNWHVRPILSENCFKCHGPDPAARKAGLRLDLGELAVQELPEDKGKFAIVPGDARRSELVRRITSTDVDERMPPESTHKSLTAKQVAILRHWIDGGAQYRPHWAFIKPERPPLPQTALAARAANDVDRFVLARLEREGLSPTPEADKETLINRVTLTLTGLPPKIEDVDAFVADAAPDAYERLVDRLLASPAYAEHMADYWMDLARWSESDGFLDDHHDRFLWPWRDWVIEAFRTDMPYDRFGTAQLAGDLLPNATKDQVLATAYLRVGKRTTENGAIDAEYKAEYMVERTDNALGVAFLGLTVGCARCHDHKYDPIRQRDYYALGAFFNSNDEPGAYAPGFSGIQGGPTLPWPDAATQAKLANAAAAIAARAADYDAARAAAAPAAAAAAGKLAAAGREPVAKALRGSLDAALAAHYGFDSTRPAALADLPRPRPARIPPVSLMELGRNPFGPPPPSANETSDQRRARERAELAQRVPRNYNAGELTLSPSATRGVAPAVIQGPVLKEGVRGQALFFDENNRGFLGSDVGWYDRQDPFTVDFWFYVGDTYENAPVLNHLAEQNSGRTGYRFTIDKGRLWVSLAHSPPANMIALETTESLPVREWSHITFTYDGSSRAAGMRLYLNGKPAPTEVTHDYLTRSILPWSSADVFDPFLGVAFGTRFREKAPVGSALDELSFYSRDLAPLEVAFLHDGAIAAADAAELAPQLAELGVATDAKVAAARGALTQARAAENEVATAVPQVLVMGDAPQPIPTFVLNRGVYSALGEQVAPHGLEAVLPWNESLPQNRLGLAQWLFDARNPLTARVFVNRIWQMHFGRGIVETAEDFGSQGSIPTHPELLDWLAVQFIESGWDIKALHRLIVTSAAYKQSSEISADLLARDAHNELYGRGPRWRMSAEMVRDSALAASGLLVAKVGGASVKPYQPEGIWNPLNSFYAYASPEGVPADDLHRRTLYTFVKRNAPHPGLKIFDFTNRTESVARRRSSNTPLQALLLENDPQYVEAYRSLAEAALKSSSDERAQLTRLYRLAARSTPAQAHLDLLSRFYGEQRKVFAASEEKTAALLGIGVVKPDPALDRPSLAALTNVAALVMNSPDAYTVR